MEEVLNSYIKFLRGEQMSQTPHYKNEQINRNIEDSSSKLLETGSKIKNLMNSLKEEAIIINLD